MDESAVAHINSDVRIFLAFLVEKNKVSAPEIGEADRPGRTALFLRSARHSEARLSITVLNEAAAIETG